MACAWLAGRQAVGGQQTGSACSSWAAGGRHISSRHAICRPLGCTDGGFWWMVHDPITVLFAFSGGHILVGWGVTSCTGDFSVQILLGLTRPGLAWACHAKPGLAWSGQAWPGFAWPAVALSGLSWLRPNVLSGFFS